MVKELTTVQALLPFLSKPKEELHLAFIAKDLGENHTNIRLWLAHLEERGIVRKSYKGRLTLFALNYDHELLLEFLVVAEKMKLINRAEEDLLLKELLSFLHGTLFENTKAILFGSAVFSFKDASDIDILLTGKYDQKAFYAFSKKINKQIHIIPVKALQDISASLKTEIIKKHFILKGSEDIVRWLFW
jgi:DNA-binding transcriptional ArsR family regulator